MGDNTISNSTSPVNNTLLTNCILEECAAFIASQEKKLPPFHRLHLFYELPEQNSNTSPNAARESTLQYALHCIHSLYVYFENCPHNGPAKISSGIGLFHTERSRRQANSSQAPSESVTRLDSAEATIDRSTLSSGSIDKQPDNSEATAGPNENEEEQNEAIIQSQYTECSNNLRTNENTLPWFPSEYELPEVIDLDDEGNENVTTTDDADSSGKQKKSKSKVKEYKKRSTFQQGDVLKVPGSIVDQLSEGKSSDVLHIYQVFFNTLHNILKKSDYKNKLVSEKNWRGKLSYSHFTAPWMRRVLSVATEVVFINPLGIKAVPDHRGIRSTAGSRKATFILAAYYDNEPMLRGILTKVVYDRIKVHLGLFMNRVSKRQQKSPVPPSSDSASKQPRSNNNSGDFTSTPSLVRSNTSPVRSTNSPTSSQEGGVESPSEPTQGLQRSSEVQDTSDLEPHNIAPILVALRNSPPRGASRTPTHRDDEPPVAPMSDAISRQPEDALGDSSLTAILQQQIPLLSDDDSAPPLPNNSPLPPQGLQMQPDENSYDQFARHDDDSRDLCTLSTEAIAAASVAVFQEEDITPITSEPVSSSRRQKATSSPTKGSMPRSHGTHNPSSAKKDTASTAKAPEESRRSPNELEPSFSAAKASAKSRKKIIEKRSLRSSSNTSSQIDEHRPEPTAVQQEVSEDVPTDTPPSSNNAGRSTLPTDFSAFNNVINKKKQRENEMKKKNQELRRQRDMRLTRGLAIKKMEEEQKAKELAALKKREENKKSEEKRNEKRTTRSTSFKSSLGQQTQSVSSQQSPETRCSTRSKSSAPQNKPVSVLRTRSTTAAPIETRGKRKRKVSFADEGTERRRTLRSSSSPPSKRKKTAN